MRRSPDFPVTFFTVVAGGMLVVNVEDNGERAVDNDGDASIMCVM